MSSRFEARAWARTLDGSKVDQDHNGAECRIHSGPAEGDLFQGDGRVVWLPRRLLTPRREMRPQPSRLNRTQSALWLIETRTHAWLAVRQALCK